MTNDLITIAPMNGYVLSSSSKPIIATYGLSTCIGLIISDEKKSALAHIADSYDAIIREIVEKLENTGPLNVLIIPGYYENANKINEIINYLNDHHNFFYHDFNIKVVKLEDYKSDKYTDVSFGFDTRTSEFIKIDFDELLKKEDNYGRN